MATPEKHSDDDHNPLDLTVDELATLQEQIDIPVSSDGYYAIFRYASGLDFAVMCLSSVMAAAAGTCQPLMTVRKPPRLPPGPKSAPTLTC